MSDRADLVQNDFESAERRQRSGDGLDGSPPSHLIRSYDRQPVRQRVPSQVPPPYVEDESRPGGQVPKQEPPQNWGWQQSERGDYHSQTNAGYNQEPPHQQFQQQAPPHPSAHPQTVTVIRVTDNNSVWATYWKIRCAFAVVGAIIGVLVLLTWLISSS